MTKLAVSNIAWPRRVEADALACLNKVGIRAIEVAPTALWPEWIGAGQPEAGRQLGEWRDQGVHVSSLQALLYAKPDALLFGDDASRERLVRHLEFCAGLAEAFGAGPLVLGAPKNRLRGAIEEQEAFEVAAAVLRRVAPIFEAHDATLCLEPNPKAYGCDFAVNAADTARLVRMVDHLRVRLHLDTACMFLAGDNLADSIRSNADILAHFHVSEPQLSSFASPIVPHEEAAKALERIDYQGWVALEMRATQTPLESLMAATVYLTDIYA